MYRTNEIPSLTADMASKFLAEGRYPYQRTLAHNTELWHTTRGGGSVDVYGVRLYNTDIAQLIGGRYLYIDTKGWWSVTTMQRLNALLPSNIHIGSDRGRMTIRRTASGYYEIGPGRMQFVTTSSRTWWHPFADGLVLDIETKELVLRDIPSTILEWERARYGGRIARNEWQQKNCPALAAKQFAA